MTLPPRDPSSPSHETLANAIRDILLFVRCHDGRIVGANEAAVAAYGYARDELLARSIAHLRAPETAGLTRQQADEAYRSGLLFESLHRRADGTIFPVEVSSRGTLMNGEATLVSVVREISERKRAELALRESEQRFRVAFQTSPDWISVSRLEDGVYVAMNDAFARATGWTEAEVVGRSSLGIGLWVDPEDRARLLRTLRAHGRAENVEIPLRTRAGRVVPTVVSARVITLDGKEMLLAFARDVTGWRRVQAEIEQRDERLRAVVESGRRTEDALRESEARFQVMADGAPVLLWVTDDCGGNLFVNRAYQEYFGLPLEELQGVRVQRLLHPDDAQAYFEHYLACVRDRRPFSGAVRVRRRDGEWRWVASDARPRHAPSGEFLGFVGISRDVTEHRNAMAALEERAALLHLAGDAILVRGSGDEITFWSRGAEQAYGFTQAEALGARAHELLRARFPVPLDVIATALESNGRWEGELVHTRKDGREIVVTSRWAVQRDALGQRAAVLEINRDVTEQRRLEEQFQQAQRLESIGRLAGGVAHDFNNLLTVVLSCAEELKEDAGRRPPDPALVEEIAAAGERARDLTRQLLAFARKQVIAPVPLDLNDIVGGSRRMLERVLGEDVELRVDGERALWSVRCDLGQIEQVLVNLAVNARDAMARGGTLSISTRNVVVADGDVAARLGERAGEFVMLLVRDSGAGMTAEVKAHLFEPFFTTKAKGHGTGLGLATVHGIVKQAGGFIHVTSEPGEGTAFRIFLPRTHEPVVAPPRAPPSSTLPRGNETVLVVEDDPRVRSVTVRALESAGYRVVVAASGREALGVHLEAVGPVRLLVTDVVIPGLDGPSLAAELCRRHAGLRVLYVSGYPEEALGDRGVLDGSVELLPKPFTAASLLARVRAVLDRR